MEAKSLLAKISKDNVAYRWLQLSAMLGSGIAPETAVRTLTKNPHRNNNALLRAANYLQNGQSMSAAFKQTKLLSKHDLAIFSNAERAGRIPQGLESIARDQMTRWQQQRTLETGLLLPKAILFIGAIAALFIQTLQNQGSLNEAFISIAIITVVVLLITRLFVVLWSLNALVWLSLLWPFDYLKSHNNWFKNHFEYNFFRNLRWQLQAGVAADEALYRCTDLIKQPNYRKQVNTAISAVKEGQSLATSLYQSRLVLSNRMKQTLLIADEVGIFDKSLKLELDWLQRKINMRTKEQIKWLPKAYYFIVLAVIFKYFF